jgi:hypothetical protein
MLESVAGGSATAVDCPFADVKENSTSESEGMNTGKPTSITSLQTMVEVSHAPVEEVEVPASAFVTVALKPVSNVSGMA